MNLRTTTIGAPKLSRRQLLLLAPLVLASCASYVADRYQSMILEALPKVFGPADRYEVTVRGANADGSQFDHIHATGLRVRRHDMPVLDRLEVDLRGVSIDRSTKQVSDINAATATMQLRATDLSAHLSRQRWIERGSVRLEPPDGIILSGHLRIPGLAVAPPVLAEIRGRLVPSGPQLLLAIDGLSLGAREVPGLARLLVEQAVNPVFDLSAYAAPSQVDRVVIDSDTVRIESSGSRMRIRR